ncbi:hypothetical protein BDM02DRAFT_3123697 [Thelephora ganbajun]|uniref:Uncharacterized protein n=1 Tax=Thelephora ganbajun TaxID=370292 RepID=A0ACB6Z0I9_THEGA|nr:hypothetical protein BDM02DRAFT_3123697 [Thelephora ganbajun]
MAAKRACLTCRVRKVKCVPATPRCLRCTELKIDECLYVSVKKRGTGNTLRMGEACQRCRKRKRRCDAKHPCTPCIKLNEGSNCVYEQSRTVQRMREKLPAAAQPFLFSFKSEPSPCDSSSSWVTSEDSSLSASDIASPDTSSSAFSSTDPTSSRASPEGSCSPESGTLDESDPPTPQETSNSETQLVPFREESPEPHQPATIPAFSFLPSLRFPSIPRQLHMPLSLYDPERFQISDTTTSELDLSFRLAALRRLRQFGMSLTGLKQDAIMRGDTSNTIVHPFFIPATAGLGMHFCADVGHSPTMVRLHAEHGQQAFEQVAEINKGSDTNLKAQVFLYVTTSSLYGRWFKLSRQYLTKACIALNAANLRFIPVIGRPPALTEDICERFAILSQIIYFENYMFFAVDGVEPKMTMRIEKEFRDEVQQIYPRLFEICPLTMRTEGILLVKDVVFFIALCSTDGVEPGQRKQLCDELVTRLDEYSDTLLQNIQSFQNIGDNHGAEIIQGSCVSCLAHLAVLCDLVGRLEPNSKPQMDAICDSSLERLGDLTQGMNFDEFTYLDLLLRISWERSLVAFDSRIDYLSHEEGASLRRHREIVAKAWSDFKARLPEETPPTLTTLLVFTDGRERESRYPNFMLASERWYYGL